MRMRGDFSELCEDHAAQVGSLAQLYHGVDWTSIRWADVSEQDGSLESFAGIRDTHGEEASWEASEYCCFRVPFSVLDLLLPEWDMVVPVAFSSSPQLNALSLVEGASLGGDVFARYAHCEQIQSDLNNDMEALFLRLKALPNTAEKNQLLNELRKIQDGVMTHAGCVDSVGFAFRRLDEWSQSMLISAPSPACPSVVSLHSRAVHKPGPCHDGSLLRDPGFGKGPRRTRRKR